MIFTGIKNILEVIKLRNRKREIVFGLKIGSTFGFLMGMFAIWVLNILSFVFPKGTFILLATIIAWMSIGIFSALFYKSFRRAIYNNVSFLIGLLATVAIINYIYNILILYNIDLPYNSLRTIKIVALVVLGTGLCLIAKTISEESKQRKAEAAQ
ncbi:MAG: hypothetical protein KAU07_01000 [Candidatus Andersenbacteria bacterium]|nr:hypothetical protein [Candidatus Andersenbacteria bacterium]